MDMERKARIELLLAKAKRMTAGKRTATGEAIQAAVQAVLRAFPLGNAATGGVAVRATDDRAWHIYGSLAATPPVLAVVVVEWPNNTAVVDGSDRVLRLGPGECWQTKLEQTLRDLPLY